MFLSKLLTYFETFEFSLLVKGRKKKKTQTSNFSKCFLSKLLTYFEKSKFSLFAFGQKTKSRRLQTFFQTFLL